MIDNATWENLYTSDTPYNIQLLIEVSGGTYLTNTEIASESFSLTEMISDSTQLKFGGCNASQLRLRIRSSVSDMTGKTVTVKMYSYVSSDKRIVVHNGAPMLYDKSTGEYESLDNSYFLIGTYKVRTDKPTPDKNYRDISAFDAMERIINEDIAQWYNSLFDTYPTLTIKQLRDYLLAHYGITAESFTGVNDSLEVGRTITTTAISGKTILAAICELNGCFGYITRDNKFRCKVLEPTVVKTYTRYKQGQINYQDAIANVITQITVVNEVEKASASVGASGNTYLLSDNPMLTGKTEDELSAVATNLLPIISATAYRPFSVNTYGDACVELGDFIEIPTSDKTVEAYVLQRELTGTQAFRDHIEAKGEEKNASGATGSAATISRLNSNLEVVSKESELQYYIFRSAVPFTISDGDEPSRIARIRYVSTRETTVNIWHEFKMDCDIDSGSDRVKVHVYYYHDDILVDYQPIETWNLDDYHLLNLMYALEESIPQAHTWDVYIEVEGGSVHMDAGDAGITLHGQGLIAQDKWDGLIEVEDEYTPIALHDALTTSLSDTAVVSFITPMSETVSDTYTPIALHDSLTTSLSDNVSILFVREEFYIGSEDGEYILGSEDGNYIIRNEE